ncbi:MAG: 3'(2'),5'-bisphosphate nucleotidase CysQ [Gemmatimonadota bacterium]
MDCEGEGGASLRTRLPFSLDDLTAIVRRTGEEVLRHSPTLPTEEKGDGSPLTVADRAAHLTLERELGTLLPGTPCLSEESDPEAIRDRANWDRFWLVDPVDGTKEFLKGTGEFTVNVAFVEGGRPIAGIVHAPALGRTFRGAEGWGAEAAEGDDAFRAISSRRFRAGRPVLVASRDHAGPGVKALAGALGDNVEFTSMGSSLKFCLLAEGKADLYFRDRPTMEWDTGAAQSVLEAAGGRVFTLDGASSGGTLRYNKETLTNLPFLAVGDPAGPWRDLLGRAGLAPR